MTKPISEMDRNELNQAFAEKIEPKPTHYPDNVVDLLLKPQISPLNAWFCEKLEDYGDQPAWTPREFCHPTLAFWILTKLPPYCSPMICKDDKDQIWTCQIADDRTGFLVSHNTFIQDITGEAFNSDPGCAIIQAILRSGERDPEIFGEISLFFQGSHHD